MTLDRCGLLKPKIDRFNRLPRRLVGDPNIAPRRLEISVPRQLLRDRRGGRHRHGRHESRLGVVKFVSAL